MKHLQYTLLIIGLFVVNNLFSQETGLQLYSLRDQFKNDVPGTFKKISAMGIKYVEGGDGSNYGLTISAYQKVLSQNGLEIACLGASFEQLRDQPKEVLATAKALGVKYVMCAWIPHKGNDFGLKDIARGLKVFEEAGKILKGANITLCYHPHGYEFRPYQKGTLFDYMVTNSSHFEFEMDVFWVKHAGVEPLELLRKYPDRFKLMHLKDRQHGTVGNSNGQADVETNVVLGSGDVGLEELIHEAKKLRLDFLFIEDESSRVESQIPRSLEFLKAFE